MQYTGESYVDWMTRVQETFYNNRETIINGIMNEEIPQKELKTYDQCLNSTELFGKELIESFLRALDECFDLKEDIAEKFIKWHFILEFFLKEPNYVWHYSSQHWAYVIVDLAVDCFKSK